MLFRFIVAGVIVWGAFAANAGALADPASARMFKGKTAQGHRIMLVVRQRAFRIHSFRVDLRCRDGSPLLLEESGFLWTKVGTNGRFRDAQFGRTDSVYFRGRLTERRLRGRLRVTDKLRGGVRCRSRWIPFNATPPGRRT